MRYRNLSLVLAAALLAVSGQAILAGEGPERPDKQEIVREDSDFGRHGRRRGPGPWGEKHDRFGPRYGHGPRDGMRHRPDFGPGFEHGCFGGPRGFGHGFMEELDLDADQKAKLVDVLTDNFRAGLEARMELQDAKKKLHDLRKDEAASGEDIIAANTRVGEAKGKLEAAGRKGREDIRSLLTPEQLKKFDENRRPFPHDGPDRPFGPRGRDRDDRRPPMPPKGPKGLGPRR